MKRFRKVLLALAALLSVVIIGSLWLINSALNVASDAVNSTLEGAQNVQTVAQREIIGAKQSVQNGAEATLSEAEPALGVPDKPNPASTSSAVEVLPATKVSDQPVLQSTGHALTPSAKTDEKDSDDSLAEFGDLLGLFLKDGEDSSDLTSLLTAGDKGTKGHKAESKNADDMLTDMIPGANSPTVKGWMDGKYKGREADVLDDAIDDPKMWRLVFFLGGM